MNIATLCWLEFRTKSQNATNALLKANFKGIRLFFNLCDLPYIELSKLNQDYINHIFNILPDPYHAWTFEGNPSPNRTGEPMRYGFDFCKEHNWLPIVCMGYQEELPHNWLGRAPKREHWDWLAKFAKEFAIYLKNTYGFYRADLEIYNEPSKLQGLGFGWDSYCLLGTKMAQSWKSVSSEYKVHIFADDIIRQGYLQNILTNTALMRTSDYISCHIGLASEDDEWDSHLIYSTTDIVMEKYPHLELALTEMSVNGIWSRLNQLPGNVSMYGIIGAIRNKRMGTATRIDDIWLYGDTEDDFKCTSPTKAQTLKDFNLKYFNSNIGEEIMLEEYGKSNTKKEAVKFIQKALNNEIYTSPHLVVDGWFGTNTENAVKKFQLHNGLSQTGIVKKAEMKILAKNHPNEWIEFSVGIHYGDK